MNSQAEIPIAAMPGVLPGVASTWKQRRPVLIRIGYLTACAVATLGWSIGLSWGAISIATWLFF